MSDLTYKDKTYSWEELKEENNRFIKSLERPDDFLNYVNLWNVLIHRDEHYCMAIDRIESLYHLIGTARFSLANSFKKFPDSDIVSLKAPYVFQLAIRANHLKNSIVWYNACEDYIYQIIWCAFELHGIKFDKPEAYKQILEGCKYNEVKKKLEKVGSNEAKTLLAYIKDYRCNEDVKYLRKNLANNLKHHGSLEVKGLFVGKAAGYVRLDSDENVDFNASWLSPDLIDIDETIEYLKRVHPLVIEFARNVIKFINFEDARGEVKPLEWEVTKPKSDYRKIMLD
ncbi:hypothetical protein [Priestia aryabhattai]|uniref:hypothetical protein n=1 Tax=Priestia aryabhattai TaxID=412384 RepID=UPI001CFC735F|nr:hypothetical protein [Priestia aryabhattai]